jgi:hypothetical protein
MSDATKLFENDGRLWHEAVMAVQSPHVCCRGQSGKHLLGMSISHFDPNPPCDRLSIREPHGCNSAGRIRVDAWSRCAYASLHEGRERVLPPRLPERREPVQHAATLWSKAGLCTG